MAKSNSTFTNLVDLIGVSNCKDPNNHPYWDNTAILITWDDWGGWYDHVNPNHAPGLGVQVNCFGMRRRPARAHENGGLFAGVALDSRGNLYGTALSGGKYRYGAVFELAATRNGRTEQTLHRFCKFFPHCADGDGPQSTPAFDSLGNLYGTTSTVTFEMSPPAEPGARWSFRVIYNAGENADLILDGANNLYGTIGAGKYGYGAVTELLPGPNGWKAKYLYSFCPVYKCAEGDAPTHYLSWDLGGNLYGTTTDGGTGQYHLGVAFQLEYATSSWEEHVLAKPA
jgi:hypothetical protein